MALTDRSGEPIGKDETEAVLATRAELGPSYDRELAESFADRIEQVVQARAAAQRTGLAGSSKHAAAAGQRQLVLGIVSAGAGIPITGIVYGIPPHSVTALAVAWLGLVGVNLAHALSGRGRS